MQTCCDSQENILAIISDFKSWLSSAHSSAYITGTEAFKCPDQKTEFKLTDQPAMEMG